MPGEVFVAGQLQGRMETVLDVPDRLTLVRAEFVREDVRILALTFLRELFERSFRRRLLRDNGVTSLVLPKTTVIGTGQMKCRERLGGLLKFYYREAA
jgi:hypothetical protein